jgi:drug/metabolite transporter (DMT)-like permease
MTLGVVLVLAAASSWGTWALFLRPSGLPATATTPLLFAVMGLVTLPFALRAPRVRWDRATIALLLANVVTDAVNVIAFFAALRHTTVAIAVITHYFAPILIALCAPRIEGTAPRGTRASAVIALIGLAIILEPWHAPAEGAVAGAALGLVSAVAYTCNVFVVRRVADRIGPVRQMSYHSLIAGALTLPFGAGALATVSAPAAALVISSAVTIGAVSGVAFVAGLQRIGAARAAVLAFAEPLVAVAVGALWFHEPLRPFAAVGGTLVLGAGVYVARQG